jgi:hypothetical protein
MEQAQSIIAQAITSIFKGGDVVAAKTSFTNQLQSLGGNTAKAGAVADCLGSLASVLVQNPTEAQKATISAKIASLSVEGISFVKSQPGLENLDTDSDIRNDTQFSMFMTSYSEFTTAINSQKANSSGSNEYFTSVQNSYASFFVLLIQTSKAVQAKKAAASGWYYR